MTNDWDTCVAAKGCRSMDDSGLGRGKRPVINVSYSHVKGYIRWLNGKTAFANPRFMAYLSLFSVTFTMPFYLRRVQGVPPEMAGLLLTVTPLVMALVAPTAGRISDRKGSRGLATIGAATLAVGLLAASFLRPESPVWNVPAALLVIGLGMAVFQTPNTAGVMRATPRARVGVGSAMISEARNVGMSIGIAMTAAITGAALGGATMPGGTEGVPADIAQSFSAGMSNALLVGASIAMCAAALSWFGRPSDAVEGHSSKT